MYPHPVSWIPAIILIPLVGALLNGLLGHRLGKGFVRTIGVGAPALAFVLVAAAFFGLYSADHGGWLAGDRGVVVLKAGPGSAHSALAKAREHLARAGRAALRSGAPDAGELSWFEEGKGSRTVVRVRNATVDDPRIQELVRLYRLEALSADHAPRSYTADLGRWLAVGNLEVRFNFVIDRLSVLLMLVITGVGFLIHLYSVGYMGHEKAGTFARYFCYLNLFVAAMLTLVMGGNLLLLFVGWEGVGLCSYLLIGFEYDDPDKAACGTKAFVVNRIGDMGFVLGAFCLLAVMRQTGATLLSLDFERLNELGAMAGHHNVLVGAGCLLLFLGCTGKSAQIPLHIWLPDAMAGPTPVSALIHAATMVTAGIYLVARLNHVFLEAVVFGVPVLGIVAVTGALTAFFAGAAAFGQDDIKKVLAYSTVSQLGYMFVGVGAAAYGAAVFHLVTHAFFKAVLFLGAGAVIHATHTQSMRRMGGLRVYMPTTHTAMLFGAAALAGFPLFAGFFSKDMILFQTMLRAKEAGASPVWWGIYLLGLFTGLLTAAYSTRMIAMTFWGEYRGSVTPHPAPPSMAAPLVVLGFLSVVGGALGLPALGFHGLERVADWMPRFLEGVWPQVTHHLEHLAGRPQPHTEAFDGFEKVGLVLGMAASVIGVALGWTFWGHKPPSRIPWESQVTGPLARARKVLANAWYFDELVNKRLVQPVTRYLANVLWEHVDDAAIDRGLVDGTGRVAVQLSLFARVFQTGKVARYAGYFVLGAVLILVFSHALPALLHAAPSGAGH
ncbi:MAG: NADH-quinone oxidoreductase subunit L [Planctomycetota bacterium]